MAMSEKRSGYLIMGVSVAVLLVVVVLYNFVPPQQPSFDILIFPKINAILNSLVSLCLLSGLYFIKKKDVKNHKRAMMTAFVLSSIFLILYVIYHSFGQETKYQGEGLMRNVYFFILITHIILAGGVLPFILFTFYRALNKDFTRHKKIARITYPIWLYVAVTGVLVYLMLYV